MQKSFIYGLDGGNSQIFQNKPKKQSAAGSFPVHFCTLRVFLKSSIAYFEEAICIGLRLIGDEFVVLFSSSKVKQYTLERLLPLTRPNFHYYVTAKPAAAAYDGIAPPPLVATCGVVLVAVRCNHGGYRAELKG